MKISSLIKLFFCIAILSVSLYSYIDMQNTLTALRIRIPELSQEVKNIEEENIRLQYAIDEFENPLHLIELAKKHKLDYLKHPLLCEIVHLKEGMALQLNPHVQEDALHVKQPRIALTLGAKP